MINRSHRQIIIECDSCGAEYKGELDEDFPTVWAHSKLDGWKVRKIADEWLHGCPKCGVPT